LRLGSKGARQKGNQFCMGQRIRTNESRRKYDRMCSSSECRVKGLAFLKTSAVVRNMQMSSRLVSSSVRVVEKCAGTPSESHMCALGGVSLGKTSKRGIRVINEDLRQAVSAKTVFGKPATGRRSEPRPNSAPRPARLERNNAFRGTSPPRYRRGV